MNAQTALKVLLSAFPIQDRGNSDMTAAAYAFAIDGLPDHAVTEAVKRFIRGEVEGHNGRFVPSPAELAKVARTIAAIAEYRPTRTLQERVKMAEIHGMQPTTFLTAAERAAYRPPALIASGGVRLDIPSPRLKSMSERN